MSTTRPSPLARLLVALVTLYQRAALVRAPRCRFHPTCSNYALEALTLHGAGRGSWLAARRILRCHPFHAGGVDHVPGHDAGDDEPADDPPGNHTRTSIDPASRDAVVA